MMLAQQIDMQWYCVEQARSFNDLSAVIANGDYLDDKLCFISFRGLEIRLAEHKVPGETFSNLRLVQ